MVLRVAVSAAIGGTSSELGGGKFANGAITAAFGRMYNEHGIHVRARRFAVNISRRFLGALGETVKQRAIDYKDGFIDAAEEGVTLEAGSGAGFELKETKFGPIKFGGGATFAAVGVGTNSDGLYTWGESTAGASASFFKLGGGVYAWDVEVDSQNGITSLDAFGYEPASWDWSIGTGATVYNYSFRVEWNAQPLIDYMRYGRDD